MTDQWNELKATITELRDNGGKGTQQDICKFLVNLMDALEKQMQEPCKDCISRQAAIDAIGGNRNSQVDTTNQLAHVVFLRGILLEIHFVTGQ